MPIDAVGPDSLGALDGAAIAPWLLLRRKVREAAMAVLPRSIYLRVLQRRKEQLMQRESAGSIDLSAVRLLRESDPAELRDADRLESELLPGLGLNDEMLEEGRWGAILPERLHGVAGEGLRSWQLPNQFARYLAHLSGYPIRSYLEIGVRHGGTFVLTVEYLSRFQKVETALGVDISGSPSTAEYSRMNPCASFRQINTRSRDFRRLVERSAPWDLVLIDGDHTEEAVRRDLETVRDFANILVFHDIVSETVPGVRKVWSELKTSRDDRYDFFEFTDQYDDVVRDTGLTWLGLGVAVDKSFARQATTAVRSASAS